MEYIKILKIADVREVLDKLGREEISYSKMVELLNIKINEQLSIYGVRKRYKFTFKDEEGLEIIVNEDSESKGFRTAFYSYQTPKDRELTLVKKEINAF